MTWTLSAAFTGFADPTAYFGEFDGDILAEDGSLARIVGFEPLTGMRYPLNTQPTPLMGGLRGLQLQSWVIFGNNDPSNPRPIFQFTTEAGTDAGIFRFREIELVDADASSHGPIAASGGRVRERGSAQPSRPTA